MAKYDILVAGDDGWSEWRWPQMHSIRMACCDCGLVHEVEVTVHKLSRGSTTSQEFRAFNKPTTNHRIKWRWRRNNRATGQTRRYAPLKSLKNNQ